MGKAKKTRKFAAVKRMLNTKTDTRLCVHAFFAPADALSKPVQEKQAKDEAAAKEKEVNRVCVADRPGTMLMAQRSDPELDVPATQRGAGAAVSRARRHQLHQPLAREPRRSHPRHDGLPLRQVSVASYTDRTDRAGIPCVSDCVIAELEKLGPKYRLALRVARDPQFERLPCSHKGTYADDCLVQRVTTHRCYIVGTNDAALRRRLRKIPGVPLMAVAKRRYKIERLPDQGAPQ